MQEVTLTLPVKTHASVTPEEIAHLVRRLIDAGLADAAATLEDGGNCDAGDVVAAERATDLHIGVPTVAQPPRVLVVVSGGVADPIYDAGVDVEVFDWDNYHDEEPAAQKGVPPHFADLAEPIDVPVEAESFTEANAAALRASGITDYCNEVCGGGQCGGAGLCQYGIDSATHMPPEAGAVISPKK